MQNANRIKDIAQIENDVKIIPIQRVMSPIMTVFTV